VSVSVSAPALERLHGQNPEWRPWLDLLCAVRDEMTARPCDAAVPDVPSSAAGRPLLDGAELTPAAAAADAWVRRLLTLAARHGGPAASLAAAARSRSLDAASLLEAAIAADRARLDAVADATGADADALAAVAPLAAMPLLQACGRRWRSRMPASWDHGYCPTCGAWPAYAEARGLERARRLRCARCGGDWWIEWLRCPHCGTRDHERLGALVPEGLAERRKVETCGACRRYVKTVTTLTPTAPADVAVEDLATVELDVAALAHGYVAADGLGFPLTARVIPRRRRGWLGAMR
jgi:FdhE protein